MKIVMVLKSAAATAAVLGVWSQVSIINLPFLQVTYSRITWGNAGALSTSFCRPLELLFCLFCEGLHYFTAL